MNATDLTTRYLFFTGKGGVGKTSISCDIPEAFASNGEKE